MKSLCDIIIFSIKIYTFDNNSEILIFESMFHKILRKIYLFTVLFLLTLSLHAQTDKNNISKSLDSLQSQIKNANEMLTTYGDSVQSKAFLGKSMAQEYLDAVGKLKTASWKSYTEQVFAESMLLPAFSGQKDLMSSLMKIAKNNKIDYPTIRKKMTSEILKYDVVLLMSEVAPKYEAFVNKKKTKSDGLPMSEPEASEAKMVALNIATSQIDAFMKRNKVDNPRLSLDEWKKFWTDLLKDKKHKEAILKGQKGLKDHPQLVEKEKSGSNMRDAFTALMNLQH